MVEKNVRVALAEGLQARPAALFVEAANGYKANIFMEKTGKRINAKSIMGLMSLAVSQGDMITIFAEGKDAEQAIGNLTEFIEKVTV